MGLNLSKEEGLASLGIRAKNEEFVLPLICMSDVHTKAFFLNHVLLMSTLGEVWNP
jgi:hypothetical protein